MQDPSPDSVQDPSAGRECTRGPIILSGQRRVHFGKKACASRHEQDKLSSQGNHEPSQCGHIPSLHDPIRAVDRNPGPPRHAMSLHSQLGMTGMTQPRGRASRRPRPADDSASSRDPSSPSDEACDALAHVFIGWEEGGCARESRLDDLPIAWSIARPSCRRSTSVGKAAGKSGKLMQIPVGVW